MMAPAREAAQQAQTREDSVGLPGCQSGACAFQLVGEFLLQIHRRDPVRWPRDRPPPRGAPGRPNVPTTTSGHAIIPRQCQNRADALHGKDVGVQGEHKLLQRL